MGHPASGEMQTQIPVPGMTSKKNNSNDNGSGDDCRCLMMFVEEFYLMVISPLPVLAWMAGPPPLTEAET